MKNNKQLTFPVYVERQPGASFGQLTTLTVQVSYDDGRTWHPASVNGSGWQRTVSLTASHEPGYVSLRTTAADSNGNAVIETIIRAFQMVD